MVILFSLTTHIELYLIEQKKIIGSIGTIFLTDKTIDNGTVLIINKYIAAMSNRVSTPNDAIVIHTNSVIQKNFVADMIGNKNHV